MEVHNFKKNICSYNPGEKTDRVSASPGNFFQHATCAQSESWVSLGRVTEKLPTVSELIYQSPLKNQCWEIVFSNVNQDKGFKKIQPGTEIFINSDTGELAWGNSARAKMGCKGIEAESPSRKNVLNDPGEKTESKEDRTAEAGLNPLSFPLVNAVSSFIGNDYSEMDCYEMIVGGLKELGIKYQGRGGLGEHLIRGAVEQGYVYNRFLNGEGLVSQSGSEVFKKTMFPVKHVQGTAKKLMADMDKILEPGQILSFSTRTRGHTGVVSKKQGVWTFINSGKMDNTISGDNGKNGVGEENLEKELENWLTAARNMNQGLKITIGAMDMEKLAQFNRKKISEKV
ncbi:MAG: hypothetical protein U9P10_14220 [Thermodesulfobacteriota bacterium]|nr:hypothetical protein [Thermodesulfobacteriota bacterium]